jgi:hypothetical protein
MRKSLLFFAIVVSAGLVADAASAEIRPLQNKWSRAALQRSCAAGGGTFSDSPDGGGYGCYKSNCDGKGGLCSIGCDNQGNCKGQTPGRFVSGGKSVAGATSGNSPVRVNTATNPVKVPKGAVFNSSLRFRSVPR